jgi:isochorismate synthase EntC
VSDDDTEADDTAESTASVAETARAEGVTARYRETDSERLLVVIADAREATVAQNVEGYAMLKVRDSEGDERERYYGFDMALDHAAELVGVSPHEIPVPDAAEDMGM